MVKHSWTFVTTYFRNHGISYFEMILKVLCETSIPYNELLQGSKEEYDQIKLARTFHPGSLKSVDQAIYLVPRGFLERNMFSTALKHHWHKKELGRLKQSIIEEYAEESEEVNYRFDNLLEQVKILEENSADNSMQTDYITLALDNDWTNDQMHDLWQIIHKQPLDQQIKWFVGYSHFKDMVDVGPWDTVRDSNKKIKIVEIGDPEISVENLSSWVKAVNEWIDDFPIDKKLGINLFGTSTENQLAWRYLKPRKIKLKQTVFFHIKTKYLQQEQRQFRTFQFLSTIQDLIEQKVPFKPEIGWYSKERKQALKKLGLYKEWNDLFSIVVFGNRGTGKSRMIRDVFLNAGSKTKNENDGVVEVNCAAIPDTLAESRLFGHTAGAFTDAKQRAPGAFGKLRKYNKKTGKYGVLFLDEFHHLSKNIQSKLLVALQADSDGMYTYTPEGSTDNKKVKFQLILGTNRTEQELKKEDSPVFPDFLDRILQRKVHMPDLNQGEVVESWRTVWKQMNFTPPVDDPLQGDLKKEFRECLMQLRFPGNFRDVERLCILTADIVREYNLEAIDLEAFKLLKAEVENDEGWKKGSDEHQKESSDCDPLIIKFKHDWYSDPKSTVKKTKKTIAERLINFYGGKTRAVDAVKKAPGEKLCLSTLDRWLKEE